MIIAISISVIVLHRLRYDLLHQRDVPFGLLSSPFQLSSIYCLCSWEFYGAMKASYRKKPMFGIFVIIAAALIGVVVPSLAIIMISSLDQWNMQSTFTDGSDLKFLLRSASKIWPNLITKDLVPSWETAGEVNCYTNDATLWGWCPAADWHDVYIWVSNYQSRQLNPNITLVNDGSEFRYLTSSHDPIQKNSIGW